MLLDNAVRLCTMPSCQLAGHVSLHLTITLTQNPIIIKVWSYSLDSFFGWALVHTLSSGFLFIPVKFFSIFFPKFFSNAYWMSTIVKLCLLAVSNEKCTKTLVLLYNPAPPNSVFENQWLTITKKVCCLNLTMCSQCLKLTKMWPNNKSNS